MTQEEAIKKIETIQAMLVSPHKEDREYILALQMGKNALNQPQIVRCRDCRFHCSGKKGAPCGEFVTDGLWFCADGERKGGDENGKTTESV